MEILTYDDTTCTYLTRILMLLPTTQKGRVEREQESATSRKVDPKRSASTYCEVDPIQSASKATTQKATLAMNAKEGPAKPWGPRSRSCTAKAGTTDRLHSSLTLAKLYLATLRFWKTNNFENKKSYCLVV